MMETWILAAEEGAEASSGLDLLLPATPELVGGIIAFGIVFFFIWKWAGPAINRSLEQRQQAIAGRLEEAEKAKAEAESLLADYRQQMAEARQRASEIIDEARQAAEQLRDEILAKANEEAAQIVAKARDEAAAERQRVLAEAREEVANLSLDLAERVIGEALDREAQLGLVQRYLAELER
ncbi:MAG: ATP synthase subunit b [Acidimicrobiia bacterium]|nr:MAG: ATP synthase subunit b [Acidimicrobiia bacterium]